MEMPVTPEKVLTALLAKHESGEDKHIQKPPAIGDAVIERSMELLNK